MQSNDPAEAAQPSLLHRFQSDLERITQVVSYVGAIGTIFQAVVHLEDTVNLLSENIVAALVRLGGLALLFLFDPAAECQTDVPTVELETLGQAIEVSADDSGPV